MQQIFFTWAISLFLLSSLSAYEEIHDKRKLEILSPSLKDQKSAKIRLSNGLEALIISDPSTNKSGAVLTVLSGSWSDPVEHPGMAHFLEHMLFMGTQDYPIESEYQRFIHDHGGEANAFTLDYATSYMFSIDTDYLKEALSRFSSFFKAPLLNPSQTERELKAIDQEYAKNLENDDVRELFVHRSLLNPKHPSFKFSMGNSSTLKNVTPKELRDWYEKHYSANLMRLIVIGKEPLDVLNNLVDKMFGGIPNKNIEKYIPRMPLSNPEFQGKLITIEPIKDVKTLNIVFELPQKFVENPAKPYSLISHILGHEGEGSLLSVLKERQLAEGISTSEWTNTEHAIEFAIEISLTKEGVKHWEEVALLTFQAIKKLSQEEIPAYVFNDLQSVQKMEYQFQTRKDVFSDLLRKGEHLSKESIDTFPEKTFVLDIFDPEAVLELAKTMTRDKAYFYLKAKNLKLFTTDQKEKWVGAKYGVHPLPEKLINSLSKLHPNEELHIPSVNFFLPKDFTQRPKEEVFSETAIIPLPKALLMNQNARILFAQETRFQEPKCSLSFFVRTPLVNPKNVKPFVLAELYVKALNDQLNPFVYPAQLAGLNFSIKKDDLGLLIKVEGYSDTSDTLFAFIADVIEGKKLPFHRFSQYKNRLMADYQNALYLSPVQRSFLLLKASLYKYYPLPEEKAEVLKELTEEDLREFTKTLFSEGYVDGVIVGNLSSIEAKKIAIKAQEVFAKTPYEKPHFHRETLNLKDSLGPLYLEQEIEAQGNAALLLIEAPFPYSHTMRAIHQILTQAIQEPFYSELRTKQQTGYIVHAFGEEIERRLFNIFVAQSTTHSPRDLLARYELFLESFLQELTREELTRERFDTIKSALIFDLKNPVKNLTQTAELLSNLLFLYDGDFHWIEKRLTALQELSYEECIEGIRSILGKSNKKRFALLLTGRPAEVPTFEYHNIGNLENFKEEEEYQLENK